MRVPAAIVTVEWGCYGITVNAVAPTFIHTPGTAPDLADPAFRAEVEERIAGLHRIGEPMEIAGAVVFLASPAASLINRHHPAHRRRLGPPGRSPGEAFRRRRGG